MKITTHELSLRSLCRQTDSSIFLIFYFDCYTFRKQFISRARRALAKAIKVFVCTMANRITMSRTYETDKIFLLRNIEDKGV